MNDPTAPNQHAIELWGGDRGQAWVSRRSNFEAQLSQYNPLILNAAQIEPGMNVVDIGCGTGDLSRAAQERVTDSGRVAGVDISRAMIEAAKSGISKPPPDFSVGDVQVCGSPLEGVDRIISRFGVMFFADPRSAFSNVARWCNDDARLAFVCWGPEEKNPWLHEPAASHADLLPPPPPPDAEDPGPFSLADPQTIAQHLIGSWTDVTATELDLDIYLGGPGTVEDAIDFIISGSRLALILPRLVEEDRGLLPAIRNRLRIVFETKHDGTGVKYPSNAWLVDARLSI